MYSLNLVRRSQQPGENEPCTLALRPLAPRPLIEGVDRVEVHPISCEEGRPFTGIITLEANPPPTKKNHTHKKNGHIYLDHSITLWSKLYRSLQIFTHVLSSDNSRSIFLSHLNLTPQHSDWLVPMAPCFGIANDRLAQKEWHLLRKSNQTKMIMANSPWQLMYCSSWSWFLRDF